MSDWLLAAAAWLAGIVLGIFFYAGLWLTVRKGLEAKLPGVWFALSMVVRTGVVLVGLYFVSGRQWPRLVLALAGFVLARLVLTRKVKKSLSDNMTGGEPREPDA